MDNYQNILKSIKQQVRQTLKNESTGHGYWHSYRVVNLAKKIAKKEGGDLQIIELAAWLHDIAVPRGRDNHHLNGAKMAKQILTSLKLSKPTIQQITNCILKHRYSKKYTLTTIEEKIIQDADNLDALGAIIIPRIFAHAGTYNIPLYDPHIKPNQTHYLKTGRSTTAFNHIYEKLLYIPKTLNTKTAKQIAKHRVQFLKTFVKEYLAEFKGKK